jgi:hypothetical protein
VGLRLRSPLALLCGAVYASRGRNRHEPGAPATGRPVAGPSRALRAGIRSTRTGYGQGASAWLSSSPSLNCAPCPSGFARLNFGLAKPAKATCGSQELAHALAPAAFSPVLSRESPAAAARRPCQLQQALHERKETGHRQDGHLPAQTLNELPHGHVHPLKQPALRPTRPDVKPDTPNTGFDHGTDFPQTLP